MTEYYSYVIFDVLENVREEHLLFGDTRISTEFVHLYVKHRSISKKMLILEISSTVFLLKVEFVRYH